MRLDYDCLLDLMLCVEETCTVRKMVVLYDVELLDRMEGHLYPLGKKPQLNDYQKALLAKYSNEMIIYHINYCVADELFVLYSKQLDEIKICDLTPKGHKFVGLLRSKTIGEKVKSFLKANGTATIQSLVEFSFSELASLVKKTFGA